MGAGFTVCLVISSIIVFFFVLAVVSIIFASTEIANVKRIKEGILHEHNKYRAMHAVPGLQMDMLLNREAQKWANVLASQNSLDIPTRRAGYIYGENIWATEGVLLNDILKSYNPVRDWYNGKLHYPGHYSEHTFHNYEAFTQLIWKNTKRLGVGVAVAKDDYIFVVCDYAPKGNIIGNFEENVLPKVIK